ncbi:MotA/TolQ/ExbB proton channel family protein [Thermopirellula anaerolimosa]
MNTVKAMSRIFSSVLLALVVIGSWSGSCLTSPSAVAAGSVDYPVAARVGAFIAGSLESAPILPLPPPGTAAENSGSSAPSGPPPVAQAPTAKPDSIASPGLNVPETVAAPPTDRGVAESSSPNSESKLSLWGILKAGGTVGFLIILLSLATVALAVEQALTLRKSILIPESLATQVRSALAARDGKQALELCRQQPCLLSHVLLAGMAELEAGWSEVEKAVEDALAEQSARLLRKVEYLSVIGNLAPMLGLLGTVVGMILAFRTVAETQGAARAADLAEAIYLALVTTVEGLIVAIPALALYAYFRNRTDEVTAEAASLAQRTLLPLKRRRSSVKPPAAPVPEGGR